MTDVGTGSGEGQAAQEALGPVSARVEVDGRVGPVRLPLEQAVPCGLIINEPVSNALKHGFADQRSGRISVELSCIDG